MGQVQKRIDFDRGEQLALRRDVQLPSGEKFILWILDDHLRGQKFWTMTVEELAEESGYTERAVYNFINRLKDKTLVDWEKGYPGSRQLRFTICWQNLAELIEQQNGVGGGVESGSTPLNEVQCQRTTFNATEPDSLPLNEVQSQRTTFNDIYRNYRPSNETLNATITAPPAEVQQLMVMVAECGVGLAGDCIEQAIAQGMTPERIADVVRHFQQHPGRWHAGILFERLTRKGAITIPADEGWYGDAADWTAAQLKASEAATRQTPEIRWGPVLNAMDSAAVAALAERLPLRDRQWVCGRLPHGWDDTDQTTREVRKLLLEQLARESSPNREDKP